MTISDLIEELEQVKDNEGDLDVFDVNESEVDIFVSTIGGIKVLLVG